MAVRLYVLEIDTVTMSPEEIAKAITKSFDNEYEYRLNLDEIRDNIIKELNQGAKVGDVAYEYLCTNYDETDRCLDYTIEVYHPTDRLTMVIQAVEYLD